MVRKTKIFHTRCDQPAVHGSTNCGTRVNLMNSEFLSLAQLIQSSYARGPPLSFLPHPPPASLINFRHTVDFWNEWSHRPKASTFAGQNNIQTKDKYPCSARDSNQRFSAWGQWTKYINIYRCQDTGEMLTKKRRFQAAPWRSSIHKIESNILSYIALFPGININTFVNPKCDIKCIQ